jgi:hypothetical protein
MNKSLIYIVGATVLVGGAYLFLKNKKAKDLAKLDEIGGATSGGTTTGGTTSGGATSGGTTSGGTTSSLSNTSDGVSPSDANINLTNANNLVGKIATLKKNINKRCGFADPKCINERNNAKKELPIIESQLAKLGYKVDAIGTLVKI